MRLVPIFLFESERTYVFDFLSSRMKYDSRILLCCLSGVMMAWPMSSFAQVKLDDWIIESSSLTKEAYTMSGADTSMGVYCSGSHCLFYLQMPLGCGSGLNSTALFNSGDVAKSIHMQCMQLGQRTFQVLTPFNDVMALAVIGEPMGVAVPVRGGAFAVTRFECRGAKQAIEFVMGESAGKNTRNTFPVYREASDRVKDVVF